MQSSSVRYRINSPGVVSQTIDQETIIIHFESGNYYSTNQTGAMIWSLIENGATVGQIASHMQCSYEGDNQVIAEAAARFVEDLQREDLIVADTQSPSAQESVASPKSDRPAFAEPIVQKYTDMADLLLLDPVHEIEDRSRKDAAL